MRSAWKSAVLLVRGAVDAGQRAHLLRAGAVLYWQRRQSAERGGQGKIDPGRRLACFRARVNVCGNIEYSGCGWWLWLG